MKPRTGRQVASSAAALGLVGLMSLLRAADDGVPGAAPAPLVMAKRAIEPAAPLVPASVVAAMQAGQYAAAIQEIGELSRQAKSVEDQSYFGLLKGIAERLANERDTARDTLRKSLEAEPKGRWAAKIRFELAGIELAAGNWAAAEELARAEARRLLAGDRKDQLAEVYHAFARRLLEPGDPLVRPDPNAAYELADPGTRAGRKPRTLRPAPVLHGPRQHGGPPTWLARSRTSQQYLKEYPSGADRFAVRLQLGHAQREYQPTLCRPADLDRPGPRNRAPEAGRAVQRSRR